jgi:hypothetical protein
VPGGFSIVAEAVIRLSIKSKVIIIIILVMAQ